MSPGGTPQGGGMNPQIVDTIMQGLEQLGPQELQALGSIPPQAKQILAMVLPEIGALLDAIDQNAGGMGGGGMGGAPGGAPMPGGAPQSMLGQI